MGHLQTKTAAPSCRFFREATVGIEPTVRVLQTLALPLGDVATGGELGHSIHDSRWVDKAKRAVLVAEAGEIKRPERKAPVGMCRWDARLAEISSDSRAGCARGAGGASAAAPLFRAAGCARG